jgi:hypothetical protein
MWGKKMKNKILGWLYTDFFFVNWEDKWCSWVWQGPFWNPFYVEKNSYRIIIHPNSARMHACILYLISLVFLNGHTSSLIPTKLT